MRHVMWGNGGIYPLIGNFVIDGGEQVYAPADYCEERIPWDKLLY